MTYGDRRHAHDCPVTIRFLARFRGEKLPFAMIVAQDPERVLSDANANTCARVDAFVGPQAETIQEILLVQFRVFDQAFSKAQPSVPISVRQPSG